MVKAKREYLWSPERLQAATLLAEDAISDAAIADKVGVNRNTIWQWKHHEEFAKKVRELRAELEDEAMRLIVVRRHRRLAEFDKNWQRLVDLIEHRASHPDNQAKGGGGAGLLVRQQKIGGTGKNTEVIEEWVFDRAVLQELRAIGEHVAKETGQWVDRKDITTGDQALKAYVGVDLDEV